MAEVLPTIFKLDHAAILEPFVENLVEYNVSVCRFGGDVQTSAIERPKHASELLDFKTKYLSGSKTGGTKQVGTSSEGMLSLTRDINPILPEETENNIRQWAAAAFERVNGSGAPRFDFLCNAKTGEFWFNEANPCPGSFGYFLWQAARKRVLFPRLLRLRDVLDEDARPLPAKIGETDKPRSRHARDEVTVEEEPRLEADGVIVDVRDVGVIVLGRVFHEGFGLAAIRCAPFNSQLLISANPPDPWASIPSRSQSGRPCASQRQSPSTWLARLMLVWVSSPSFRICAAAGVSRNSLSFMALAKACTPASVIRRSNPTAKPPALLERLTAVQHLPE